MTELDATAVESALSELEENIEGPGNYPGRVAMLRQLYKSSSALRQLLDDEAKRSVQDNDPKNSRLTLMRIAATFFYMGWHARKEAEEEEKLNRVT